MVEVETTVFPFSIVNRAIDIGLPDGKKNTSIPFHITASMKASFFKDSQTQIRPYFLSTIIQLHFKVHVAPFHSIDT